MASSPERLPTVDEVVFSLGPKLLEKLIETARQPEWHFNPEEVEKGVISGRIAVLDFMEDGSRNHTMDTPEPAGPLILVAPAVRVHRPRNDPNREYPHITHGGMLASVICRAWDIPYSYSDFCKLVGDKSVPAAKPGSTGTGSRYFRYHSEEGLFLLQGILPRDRPGLSSLRPAFEEALGDSVSVGIGEVPPHLYHLRTPDA